MMIFQSQGQIEHLYGRPGLQSWMNGVSARVFSGIEALDECRALSEIVGSYTADVDGESRSVSSKPGLFSGVSQSVSSSNSLREAKLISPDQIRTLPGDAALVLVKGQRPLVAGLALWFRRPEWTAAGSGPKAGTSASMRSDLLGKGATVGATLRSPARSVAALERSNGTKP
jgi:type IV secretory pathway TraG/TraD family ATPase VirD4